MSSVEQAPGYDELHVQTCRTEITVGDAMAATSQQGQVTGAAAGMVLAQVPRSPLVWVHVHPPAELLLLQATAASVDLPVVHQGRSTTHPSSGAQGGGDAVGPR